MELTIPYCQMAVTVYGASLRSFWTMDKTQVMGRDTSFSHTQNPLDMEHIPCHNLNHNRSKVLQWHFCRSVDASGSWEYSCISKQLSFSVGHEFAFRSSLKDFDYTPRKGRARISALFIFTQALPKIILGPQLNRMCDRRHWFL